MVPATLSSDGSKARGDGWGRCSSPALFCVPGFLKWTDGLFMALCSFLTVRRVARDHRINILDAHFGYPTGYAAVLLGRWLRLPVMLTLRGKEERQARTPVASALKRAITGADQLITVSAALRTLAIGQGADPARVQVIGNGVDLTKFTPVPRLEARRELGLPDDAEVLVSAGTLVERKGFHRVIECLPELLSAHPLLHFVIVGGAGPEGDMAAKLRNLVSTLRLDDRVHFLGPYPSERLKVPLSAADVFVLATSYEGWANVFLEAMACGLPVVTTDVGGNAQVVNDRSLGRIVPFGDSTAAVRGDRRSASHILGSSVDPRLRRIQFVGPADAAAARRVSPAPCGRRQDSRARAGGEPRCSIACCEGCIRR